MNCHKCNFQNEATAKFCKNCGTKLKQQQTNLPKKKNSLLWILGGILVVGITAVFVLGNLTHRVQLLESITNENGYVKFEYDEQNRIIEILDYDKEGYLNETRTLTYFGDDLVKVVCEGTFRTWTSKFTKNGNKIIVTNDYNNRTIYLNADGYPIKIETKDSDYSYHYNNGNLTKILEKNKEGNTNNSAELKYDTKKTPFYYCKIPKWHKNYIYDNLFPTDIFYTQNNITKFSAGDGVMELKYEYDKAGFPIRVIMKMIYNGEETNESIVEFKYK